MQTNPNELRFQFKGSMVIEIPLECSSDDPQTLFAQEEVLKAEFDRAMSVVRGRIAHVYANPGDITVKGQLVDIHHHTSIAVRRYSRAATKASVPSGDAGLRRPGNERGPDRREAGDGPRANERDVGTSGNA